MTGRQFRKVLLHEICRCDLVFLDSVTVKKS